VEVGQGGNECQALFSYQTDHENQIVYFFDNSDSDHDIVQWIWNFGDGHMGDGQFPVHEYENPGLYEVCLVIVDETGCEDQYCHAVFIEDLGDPDCQAAFYWEYNHDTDSLEFHNTSDGNTPHTTWLWTFGDGATSTEENPQHEYAEDGIYTICLIMTDTTTDCVSDVCHTFVQQYQNEENNEEQNYQEPPPANFTDGPVIRYTNPVSGALRVTWTQLLPGSVEINLVSSTGQRVMHEITGERPAGEHAVNLVVPADCTGMYMLVVTLPGGVVTMPVIVIR
jgi:hypothetical protein